MFELGPARRSLPSPTAYGSSTNENVFLINGVNATNPEAGSFGTLVNVNYDAVEEVRIVGLGSKAEYGSFSGAAVDVMTKSGSNQFHGSGAIYSLLGSPASNQPGSGRRSRRAVAVRWRRRTARGRNQEGLGRQRHHRRSDPQGQAVVLRRVRLPAQLEPAAALVAARTSRGTTTPTRKVSAVPFKNHLIWGSYHYENNDGNGWSWGSEPAWDTTHDLRRRRRRTTRPRPSGSGPRPAHGGERQVPRVLEGRPAVSARATAPTHPGYINWWKWADYGINGAFPYVDAQKASRQTIQADLSHYAEGFLGQHDIKFGVQYTKGARQSAGRLLPELRELPLPVPLDAERVEMQKRVRRQRASLLQLQGHDQSVPDGADGRLDRRCSSTTAGRRPSA